MKDHQLRKQTLNVVAAKAGGFLKKETGEKFFVFNNGSAGEEDCTFSFGGEQEAGEDKHGPDAFVLKKWEAKEVYARAMPPPYPPPEDRSPLAIALGNLFMGTIPNGHGDDDPKIIIACQARVDADNFWLRHASVPWEGSAQEQIAKAKGCPEDVIARVAL